MRFSLLIIHPDYQLLAFILYCTPHNDFSATKNGRTAIAILPSVLFIKIIFNICKANAATQNVLYRYRNINANKAPIIKSVLSHKNHSKHFRVEATNIPELNSAKLCGVPSVFVASAFVAPFLEVIVCSLYL